ncbi:serine hydrolase [Gemmatimonas sp.]|uniref:serine hydrolase n=1 Tax=Gemmatimonas sp. TaxID=1962908 RepID=UPI0039834CDB
MAQLSGDDALAEWHGGVFLGRRADGLCRQRELNFPSGSEFSYSNTNFVLAAILVERVSGESLRRFTKRTSFDPLGMRHTHWRDSLNEIVPNRALA